MKSNVIIIIVFLWSNVSHCINVVLPFEAKWQFQEHVNGRSYKEKNWMPAVVPGSLYADLTTAGLLRNPLFACDESETNGFDGKSWVYQSAVFEIPGDLFAKKAIALRFNGLDTYARVFLNDREILVANNAHRSWQVDVKSFLKPKGNVLRIVFDSVIEKAHSELITLSYPLPGDSIRAVVRKPQFQFGWDWAPRLVGCGITKSIEWVAYDSAHLDHYYIEQLEVSESLAKLNFHFTGAAISSGNVQIEVECLYNGKSWSSSKFIEDSVWVSTMGIDISYPMLWWSNGMGNPNLTEFRCKVLFDNKIIFDEVVRTGLRSLVLTRELSGVGSTFGFELNGMPVFAKGANYVPLNYFMADAKRDDYVDFLSRCRDANINMIRVWGGGFYEKDVFYDLCDEYGIMVWQDFMFACSMYPANNSFIENVSEEATEQVIRLRNHPCIALWCGNNEVAEGWDRWGWKEGLSVANIDSLSAAYDRIFLQVLPQIVAKYSGSSYHHSSPLFGRGDKRSLSEGDMHDWGIWHDELPLEDLGRRVPRFMSEYGVQSYPSVEVLQMMSERNFSENDASVMRHQRHPRGFKLMRDYAERWYPGCADWDFRKYSIVTQAVQAEGILNAILRHRVSQPFCSGTLFWQLNDVCPAFSWSALDYAKNEKLLFSLLQEAYAPQTIAAFAENDSLKVFWISDRICDRDSAQLFLRINRPGEALDEFPEDAHSFVIQPYSCQVQMGVKLLFAEPLRKFLDTSMREGLSDWTVDCALQINDQRDFACVRKFRLFPGSREMIVPDVLELSSSEKNASLKIRRQIFKRL